MNTITAAKNMVPLINASSLPAHHPEYGKDHLLYMVECIEAKEVTGEKSHRWLSFIQGCVCTAQALGGGSSLEELKQINYTA